MDGFEELPRQTAETLAAWTLGLAPASPCFCCGSSLRADSAGVAPLPSETFLLRCPRCGAEVSGQEMAEASPTPFESDRRRRRVLVAA